MNARNRHSNTIAVLTNSHILWNFIQMLYSNIRTKSLFTILWDLIERAIYNLNPYSSFQSLFMFKWVKIGGLVNEITSGWCLCISLISIPHQKRQSGYLNAKGFGYIVFIIVFFFLFLFLSVLGINFDNMAPNIVRCLDEYLCDWVLSAFLILIIQVKWIQ